MSAGPLAARVAEHALARVVPLAVQVDLTMRCNEVCAHCYRVPEDREELGTAEVRALLDDLARAGTLYVTLSGGEVLLRPDLDDVIAHAKRRRFDVRLKSNATLVTSSRAARFAALGVRQVDVSVYSAEAAVHDAITRVPGSLARTLAGAERLRDAGVRVKLNCPLMAPNAAGYRGVRALAERLGVMCGFDPMLTARTDGDRGPVRLRLGRLALRTVLADTALNPPAACPPRGAPRDDLDEPPCGAGHDGAYVSPYGDVTPCVALPLVCGNVRERSFADIWLRSTGLRDVRAIRVRDLPTCASCAAATHCVRCPGQALVEDGDLRGPSSAACEQAAVAAAVAGSAAVPASFPGGAALAAPAT